MAIEKKYVVKDEDTIKVVYLVDAGLDDEDLNSVFGDVIEYTINSEEDLAQIPKFEERVKEREKELKEKAVRMKKLMEKLEAMGYSRVEEEIEEINGRIIQKFYER